MKKIIIKKPDFKSIRFKGGAYTAAFSLLAIILALVINFVFVKLNITFDLTDNGMYSITEETEEFLSGLEDDITIYYLEPDGSSIDVFDKILDQIDKASKRVTVIKKDPVLHPAFAAQYTDSESVNYGLIVVNESNQKYRFIPEDEYVIVDYSINYQTYAYETNTTGLDMEGKIDSAISYVTSGESAKVYTVTGHGETALGEETTALIRKANMEIDDLKLLTLDQIPEDCDVLLIQTPANDYTPEEATLIRDYLSGGGRLIVNLSYLDCEHTTLMGVLADYGIGLKEGIIFDKENRMNRIYPAYYFVANVTAADINEGVYDKKYVISQGSSALTTDVTPENLHLTNLLYTSGSAYIKSIESNTAEMEEGDESGVFYIGCSINDDITGAEICAYSGINMFSDDFANKSSYGNINILINSITDLCGAEDKALAIRAIDFNDTETLSVPSASMALTIAAVLMFIPLAMLVAGIVTVIIRRKRG